MTSNLELDTQAMRNRILDLAMRGKLVKQDAGDEPANVLLEKIKAEKAQLVKDGKIKKSKKMPEITDDEKPFDIPASWCWARLGDCALIERGGSPRPIKKYLTDSENGINWIKIGDTSKNDKYITSTKERIIKEGLKKSREVHKGDFLLSNSMSFGRPYILKIDGAIHDGWLVLSDFDGIFFSDYLYYLLSSPVSKDQFSKSATGSTVKNLNKDRVATTIVPLPPLNEQKRIVEKVEELFKQIDIIEQNSAEYKDLEQAMKNKLLDLAMRGKLVKQDAGDEPASVLLEKIKTEKAQLVKDGKIKKSKKLPEIIDAEKPFDIPASWCWVRLGDIGNWAAGATPSRKNPEYYDNGTIPWLKTGDLNDGIVTNTEEYITPKAVKETSVKYNEAGNVLIAMYGATIGKLGIVGDGALITTNQACCGCKVIDGVYNWYLFYYLKSARKKLISLGSGGAQPNISKQKIEKFLFPLPPLNEQKRIVEKLEELFKKIG